LTSPRTFVSGAGKAEDICSFWAHRGHDLLRIEEDRKRALDRHRGMIGGSRNVGIIEARSAPRSYPTGGAMKSASLHLPTGLRPALEDRQVLGRSRRIAAAGYESLKVLIALPNSASFQNLLLHSESFDESRVMRWDRTREGVVLILQASPNCQQRNPSRMLVAFRGMRSVTVLMNAVVDQAGCALKCHGLPLAPDRCRCGGI